MLGHCDNNSQKQFLPHRIANVWNSLPAADIDFTNLISFRASRLCRTLTYTHVHAILVSLLRIYDPFYYYRAHVRDHAMQGHCVSFELAHCFYLFYTVLNLCFVQFNNHKQFIAISLKA